MYKKIFLAAGLCVSLVVLMRLSFVVLAAGNPAALAQQYVTPTPLPDGRIVYIVQQYDTCERIQLLTGVTVDTIRQTNNLDENCTIITGQPLVIGYGGAAVASATQSVSGTQATAIPSPTPIPGTAEVCVLLYDDQNGDALRQETEFGIANGAISLASLNGLYSKTQNTVSDIDATTLEPVRTCFVDVPEGEYTVSAGIPDGYNATTTLSTAIKVTAGDTTYVAFGAQSKSLPAQDGGGVGSSPVLGIIGVFFILAAAGLAIVAWRSRK